MNTHEYMAEIKSRLGIDSDYALAKAMGISQTTTSSWRLGKTTISDSYAPYVAQVLGVPVEKVLVDFHAEREKSPVLQSIWRAMGEHFGKAACVLCMLTAFYITLAPRTLEARPLFLLEQKTNINSRTRLWHAVCRLAARLASWLPIKTA